LQLVVISHKVNNKSKSADKGSTMEQLAATTLETNMAQVAISKTLLEKLIAMGVLHGSECRCLNHIAKKVIWQTLLNNSLNQEY